MVDTKTTFPQDSSARKWFAIFRGFLLYFPAAIAGAARLSLFGDWKHNKAELKDLDKIQPKHARGVSEDHGDCVVRHLMESQMDCGAGFGIEPESGYPQVDFLVWRACAYAQDWYEKYGNKPYPPAAKFPSPGPVEAAQNALTDHLERRCLLAKLGEAASSTLPAQMDGHNS